MENVQLYWIASAVNADGKPIYVRSDTIKGLVDDIVGKIFEYQSGYLIESLSIDMNVLVSRNQLSRVRGKALSTIVKQGWYIVDPATKTHCVSDCCALLELYRS